MLGVDEGYHRILISQNHLDRKMPLISGQKPATWNMLACSCIPELLQKKKKPIRSLQSPQFWHMLGTESSYPYSETVPSRNNALHSTLDGWDLALAHARSVRGASGVLCFPPWPSEHFLASSNFIMKAWTATNSQIGTKPFWGLSLSTRPIPIIHWVFPS